MLVVALGTAVTVSYGVPWYAFAVLVVPMQHDLHASRAAITGAASVAVLISGFAGIPIGRLLDRTSPRVVMAAGAVAATLLGARSSPRPRGGCSPARLRRTRLPPPRSASTSCRFSP